LICASILRTRYFGCLPVKGQIAQHCVMSTPRPIPSDVTCADLPGAELCLVRGWLQPDAADALLDGLLEQVEWEVHRIRMFGRVVDSPRLSSWIGDDGASYRYSGTSFAPQPWTEPLQELRVRLTDELATPFNSVLANRYRSGSDCMGWHSDDERELGPTPVIASVSLGATRRFVLKHRHEPSIKAEIELEHGSLLVMRGDTQRLYRHCLPRTARAVGERINLTFRQILPLPLNPGPCGRCPPAPRPVSSR
jgi:alkylated DNA repair dioxygenase AlkB